MGAPTRHERDAPPLRYLSTADIDACLPSVDERVALCKRALVALATQDAEMPPKIGVHPRAGALLHAMPAWLRSADLVGLKWVSAFPGNTDHGLPAISGLVVLNDADSGYPTWVMDAARITAVRTAAVSGVAIDLFAPRDTARVALLGAGVQARSHVEVIDALLPGARVALFRRDARRARQLADELNSAYGRAFVEPAESPSAAVARAQVVITTATLGAPAQRLTPADVAPNSLIIAVDFATYVAPDLAHAAGVFAVDDRAQFVHYRDLGYFDGYPDPTTTLGELVGAAPDTAAGAATVAGEARPTLVTHLGVGLADVVFADAVARAASAGSIGQELER